MDKLAEDLGRANVIARRGEENHMDPLYRFPYNELRALFDDTTLVEAMLVALEHMQVNFITLSWSTGLRKFRRNTISHPQDIAAFARKQRMLRQFRPGDRVNSSRGLVWTVRILIGLRVMPRI